tara:strand:+ start:198 stop:344 length:147 start_codon:yes stop_codon:yes gene_type:complete
MKISITNIKGGHPDGLYKPLDSTQQSVIVSRIKRLLKQMNVQAKVSKR